MNSLFEQLLSGLRDQRSGIITADALKRQIDNGQAPILLDVRDTYELKGPVGHLPGVINIPLHVLSAKLSGLPRDKEIVIVCHSAARAFTAARIMRQKGFDRVAVLEGGMINWRLRGY
ncbi:MAG: rhodanese-like domain-containing protein [Candidatus Odinarchaeota archaeon]